MDSFICASSSHYETNNPIFDNQSLISLASIVPSPSSAERKIDNSLLSPTLLITRMGTRKSELAFYLVPMLVIRRVGDNEELSALQSAELGDGTI